MAEDDDEWEGREGRWTRSSESSEGGGDERYYELPDGEIVQGEPEGDVEAEPVEAPEEEEGGLAGLFGGDDEEPDEEDLEQEEEDSSIVPVVVGIVVLLLVLLVLLVAAAYLGIADPLGIGDAIGGDGGDDGGGGENGDGGGGNETELFSYPVNWTTSSNSVDQSSDGRLQEGNSTTVEIEIARLNVTNATLTFTWDDSDDDTQLGTNEPDNFTVTLTAPDGSSDEMSAENGADGQGEIVLNLSLAEVPEPTTVTAPNETAADENVTAQHPPDEAGFGNWTVEITLNSAPPCTTLAEEDCGEDWQLSLEYAWYEHLLGEPTEVES